MEYLQANRWMKHGISIVPIKFYLELDGLHYTVLVNIYAEDGTVAISHGGVEVGQGINTKVAQVAALTLGIPLVRIQVKPCSTITSPNSDSTGGSITSEANCRVSQACLCSVCDDSVSTSGCDQSLSDADGENQASTG